ncbi:MAG: adenylyl-sulfate kinase [Chlamydiae bacterium CG10_big_fil_rev_8_21_14_0_10_42_34]|nr:MAG: adenylyl-sulfate kinase [Chlamydiae bacterium CG10_big_fil_rev_8_21_14_0_10_42_34]
MLRFFVFIACFASYLHAGSVIWLTGLPSAGKTTIANEFHALFPESVVLDGDVLRKTINSDLGFSVEDRKKNIERTVNMATLCLESVDYVIVSCISPNAKVREYARKEIEGAGHKFLEVFVNCPVESCIERDVKGLYARAIAGEIPNFTGISQSYEEPVNADVVCRTDVEALDESVGQILNALGLVHPHLQHALFIGRWSPFHKGHFKIMEKVIAENPDRPVMIFVRDRKGERWSARVRKEMVEASMKAMNIKASVKIIPDIDSVNWGRDVGYLPRMIDVDPDTASISGTAIRKGFDLETEEWKNFVCPGVFEFLENLKEAQ